jgi:hypothetical protein
MVTGAILRKTGKSRSMVTFSLDRFYQMIARLPVVRCMQTEPLNPYESPREANLPVPPSPRKQLIARLRGPSIGLLVLSGFQAVAAFAFFVLVLFFLIMLLIRDRPRGFWFELGAGLIAFVPSAVIFCGAWQMRRMRSLQFCRVAAIMACVPYLSPFIVIGIPLGIWATVVLFQKKTAEEFNRPADEVIKNLE